MAGENYLGSPQSLSNMVFLTNHFAMFKNMLPALFGQPNDPTGIISSFSGFAVPLSPPVILCDLFLPTSLLFTMPRYGNYSVTHHSETHCLFLAPPAPEFQEQQRRPVEGHQIPARLKTGSRLSAVPGTGRQRGRQAVLAEQQFKPVPSFQSQVSVVVNADPEEKGQAIRSIAFPTR